MSFRTDAIQREIEERNERLMDDILQRFQNVTEEVANNLMSLADRIENLNEVSEEAIERIRELTEGIRQLTQEETKELKLLQDKQQSIQRQSETLKKEFQRKSGEDYDSVRGDMQNFQNRKAQDERDNAQSQRNLRAAKQSERLSAKTEKNFKRAEGVLKAIDDISKIIILWLNTAHENELSRIKQINDIQVNTLKTTQKITTSQIKLAGQMLGNSLQSAFAGLSQGVNEGAYTAASNQITEVQLNRQTQMENELDRLRLSNSNMLRAKQGRDDRTDRTYAAVGSTIVLGAAAGAAIGAAIGGPAAPLTAAIGGLIGLVGGIFTSWANYAAEERRRTRELMQSTYTLNEEFLRAQQERETASMNIALDAVKQIQAETQNREKVILRMDDAYRKTGASMGLNKENLTQYVKRMINIQKEVSEIGGEDADAKIAQMQRNFNETTGYAKHFSLKDIKGNLALGVALDDQSLADSLTSTMEYFNKSVADSSDIFYEMYTRANKAGISSKKYAKDLQQNLKLAQKYTFKGGAKGMMEMALWAQKVQFNVHSLSSMLDKVNEGGLEGVITQAAQLQVLGGSAAMGADPLAMAWEARNDPAAYAERMHNMLKDYSVFNEQTGEADMRGLNGMMIDQIAKAQGRSVEDVHAEVNRMVRSEHIDKYLTSNFNDDQKELIYSKANFNPDTQKWEYTANGVTKDINDLQQEDFVEMLPVEERIEDHAKNILTILQRQSGVKGEVNSMFASGMYDNTLANAEARNKEELESKRANYETLLKTFTEEQDRITDAQKKSNERLISSIELAKIGNEYLTAQAQQLNAQMPKLVAELQRINKTLNGTEAEKKAAAIQGNDAAYGITDDDKERLNGILNNKKLVHQTKANGRINYSFEDVDDWEDMQTVLHDPNASAEDKNAARRRLIDHGFGRNDKDFEKAEYWILNRANIQDGIATGAKNGFLAQASKVTPVNDGTANLVQSHPDDTAIFAKTGGPFDKLFNGVFGEISAVHNAMREALQPQPMPLQREEVSDFAPRIIKAMTLGGGGQAQTPTGKSGPIDININGKLEIAGENGSTPSVDILNELSTNPMFVRALTQLISEEMSRSMNVGKSNSPY